MSFGYILIYKFYFKVTRYSKILFLHVVHRTKSFVFDITAHPPPVSMRTDTGQFAALCPAKICMRKLTALLPSSHYFMPVTANGFVVAKCI